MATSPVTPDPSQGQGAAPQPGGGAGATPPQGGAPPSGGQANDLQKFLTLWHTDFLGWPSTSPEPLRKDHITDWITAHTGKGESLQSYELEPISTQVTGGIATTTYRVRLRWTDKAGAGRPSTVRVIHTWVRSPTGIWQIISGMSTPTNAEGH